LAVRDVNVIEAVVELVKLTSTLPYGPVKPEMASFGVLINELKRSALAF